MADNPHPTPSPPSGEGEKFPWKIGTRGMCYTKLKQWQPQAENVQFDVCHCPKKSIMASYQLPGDGLFQRRDGKETCGYYCPTCGFGNAGSREYIPTPNPSPPSGEGEQSPLTDADQDVLARLRDATRKFSEDGE